jgi:hypothetical protein
MQEALVKSLTGRLDEILDQPLTDDLTIVCATRSQARDEGLTDDLFQHYRHNPPGPDRSAVSANSG